MRRICTVLFLGALAAGAQEAVVAPSAETTQSPAPHASLLDVTLGFNGQDSLETLRRLLEAGAAVDEPDPAGDTPLLHLCAPLEMDYRYTTDPHFARAVDAAILLLVQRGANVLLENAKGCCAAFYLQSKPELLKQLTDAGLMPKELAVRIPYETAAFSRYMRKRIEQAKLTTHEPCRQYLIRLYCAPAYERAEQRLNDIIAQEDTRKKASDIAELLDFMRLADTEKAHAYVHNLHYWKHSEHLLEEVPSRVLDALNSIDWELSSEDIRMALKKLDTLLPSSPDEMIDCFAAQPMGILLEMLEQREGELALPLIQQYSKCNEANLASTAYALLLKRQGLPAPTPEALLKRFTANGLTSLDALSAEQRLIYECAVVDTALRSGNISPLTADMVKRVAKAFTDMKLKRYPAIVSQLVQSGKLVTDPYAIQEAHHSYIEQPPPAPRMAMARYILDHPSFFTATNTEAK